MNASHRCIHGFSSALALTVALASLTLSASVGNGPQPAPAPDPGLDVVFPPFVAAPQVLDSALQSEAFDHYHDQIAMVAGEDAVAAAREAILDWARARTEYLYANFGGGSVAERAVARAQVMQWMTPRFDLYCDAFKATMDQILEGAVVVPAEGGEDELHFICLGDWAAAGTARAMAFAPDAQVGGQAEIQAPAEAAPGGQNEPEALGEAVPGGQNETEAPGEAVPGGGGGEVAQAEAIPAGTEPQPPPQPEG